MYFLSITFTFTKPFDLKKFTVPQPSPYWMYLNQLCSWWMHPHPLLTRHELTHVMLTSSAQTPDRLATLLLHQYKQFNWQCTWACQHMWYPGRCWLSVSIFHAQGNDERDTLSKWPN